MNLFKKLVCYKRKGGFKLIFFCMSKKVFKINIDEKKIVKTINNFKHKTINKFLIDKYGHILKDFKGNEIGEIPKKKYVWTLWWQDEMPPLIKICFESIKKNFKDGEIIIITKYNFQQYVSVDKRLLNNVENGLISITHLSDVIRWKLLCHYGGYWLDATTYIKKPLIYDDFILKNKLNFWTSRLREDQDYFCISRYRWNVANIYCNKGYLLAKVVDKFLDNYLSDNNTFIDYCLTDYIINIAFNNFELIRQDLNKIPLVNKNFYSLLNNLNSEYKLDNINRIEGTMFKLSRHWYLYEKKCGKLTYYGYLLKEINTSIKTKIKSLL